MAKPLLWETEFGCGFPVSFVYLLQGNKTPSNTRCQQAGLLVTSSLGIQAARMGSSQVPPPPLRPQARTQAQVLGTISLSGFGLSTHGPSSYIPFTSLFILVEYWIHRRNTFYITFTLKVDPTVNTLLDTKLNCCPHHPPVHSIPFAANMDLCLACLLPFTNSRLTGVIAKTRPGRAQGVRTK